MEKYFFEISLFIVLVVFVSFIKKKDKTLNTVNLALIKRQENRNKMKINMSQK